jgi:signal transduction histidine kinase
VTKTSGPLVVYVDDERGNRVVFEQSLNSDFHVVTVADGPSALELLANREAAVLVTDMRMPGMTGEELLRIAKELHPQTIRMVVTAYSDVEPILRAINEGLVARYIIKPWHYTELVQILRWACAAWEFAHDSSELRARLLETERLATLGGMAGSLVHDLRTPLMSIITNVEHLGELARHSELVRTAVASLAVPADRRERLLTLVEDLPELARDIEQSAWHLSELVDRLRELGRPNTGAASNATIDPLPIVRHAMAVCQPLAIKLHTSIDYEGPHELPHVRMSATELTQVLINVVSNGAQAVAARGVTHGHVSIVAKPSEDMLELQVRDDGIGMAPDVLQRIGTPFFTTRAEGTGLGIAQCQRLIGTAGGRFRIDSEPGVGTTVTILLPIAA